MQKLHGPNIFAKEAFVSKMVNGTAKGFKYLAKNTPNPLKAMPATPPAGIQNVPWAPSPTFGRSAISGVKPPPQPVAGPNIWQRAGTRVNNAMENAANNPRINQAVGGAVASTAGLAAGGGVGMYGGAKLYSHQAQEKLRNMSVQQRLMMALAALFSPDRLADQFKF